MTESVELLRVRTRTSAGASWGVPSFGDGQFTDASVPVVVSGSATYNPLAWTRNDIGSSLLQARADLEIAMPQDCDLAVALRRMDAPWQIEVLRATELTRDTDHIDTTTTERIAIGLASAFSISGSAAMLTCRTPRALLERLGPRDRFNDTCRHALYSEGCGVNPTTHQDSGTVTSASGDTIEAGLASSAAALVGGYARVDGQTRLIIANVGDGSVKVDRPWLNPGDLVGETIICVPGCARNVTDCENKFSNLANFGGIPTAENLWGIRQTWGDR